MMTARVFAVFGLLTALTTSYPVQATAPDKDVDLLA